MAGERITPTPTMASRDEREGPTTLDELRDLLVDSFRGLSGTVATTNRTLGDLRDAVHDMNVRIERLEREVFPSKRPPGPVPPLAKRTSHAEIQIGEQRGELDELSGRLLAVEGKVDTVASMNRQQSRAMGLAKPDASSFERAMRLFASRKGVEMLISLVAALAALAAALNIGHRSTTGAGAPSTLAAPAPSGAMTGAPK